jgi:spore coat polysaccharide biosynthesis protein SpsF
MNLAIIQARMASTRLPGKVLLPLGGRPMLERMIERVRRARLVDTLVVATTRLPEDEAIEDLCERVGVPCYRDSGRAEDVLGRLSRAFWAYSSGPCDVVVRLTGDCPLSDPAVIDLVIEGHHFSGAGLTVNTGVGGQSYPDGLDVEIIAGSALILADMRAGPDFTTQMSRGVPGDPAEREHATLWLRRHPELCRVLYCAHDPDLSGRKWSVDTPADYRRVSAIFEALHPTKPGFGMDDILEWEAGDK